MDEYEFSIISAWKNHKKKKLPCDSGGATRIGSSVGGVARQAKKVRDFPFYLHLYNLESFWWIQL
jgi:hypothetical protein